MTAKCWWGDSNSQHSVLETDGSANWSTPARCCRRDSNPHTPGGAIVFKTTWSTSSTTTARSAGDCSDQELARPSACSSHMQRRARASSPSTPSTWPHPVSSRPVGRARFAGGSCPPRRAERAGEPATLFLPRTCAPTALLRNIGGHDGTCPPRQAERAGEPTISSSTERRAGRCATRPNSRTDQLPDSPAELFSPQSLGFAIKAMNGEGSVRLAAKHFRPPPGELNEPALTPGCKGADKQRREGGSCLHLRAQIRV